MVFGMLNTAGILTTDDRYGHGFLFANFTNYHKLSRGTQIGTGTAPRPGSGTGLRPVFEKESATSGKAGGLTETERLEAASSFERLFAPLSSSTRTFPLSLPVRFERGESRREGLRKKNQRLLTPALSSASRRRGSIASPSSTPVTSKPCTSGAVKLLESSGKAGGLTETERLEAASPFGRLFAPLSSSTRAFPSLPARFERGESRREGLRKKISASSPRPSPPLRGGEGVSPRLLPRQSCQSHALPELSNFGSPPAEPEDFPEINPPQFF